MIFKGKPITYLKIMNSDMVKAKDIADIARNASRLCLKQIVVSEISKEIIKTHC